MTAFYAWRKASTSTTANSNCVEVATSLTGAIGIRDTKHRTGPNLETDPATWRGLLHELTTDTSR